MLSQDEAKKTLEEVLPEVRVVSSIRYHDVYLFRVTYPSPLEADYDPFFSVDPLTGEVRDFSILTDGDISEIMALFTKAQSRRRIRGAPK